MRKIGLVDGKPASGQCQQGEQLISASCSTGGVMIGDDGIATCQAPTGGDAAAQLALTCAK